LLVAVTLLVVIGAALARVMGAFTRALIAGPQVADEQQRLRAAVEQIGSWLASAGQGLGGIGPNDGTLLVPVLYPQLRVGAGADPDTSAFTDRLTVVSGRDPPARARLGVSMASPDAPVLLASCAPGRSACGFSADDAVLIADDRAQGEWFVVSVAAARGLRPSPGGLATTYSPDQGTMLAAIDVRAIVHDGSRRQLRLVAPGIGLPLVDGVAALTVRWFGDPQPPRGPRPPPGQSNCVVDSSGSSRMVVGSTTDGPWMELRPAELTDGPWCGIAPWRFDADLLRVRMLRVSIRLDPVGLAGPGGGGGFGVQFDIAPRNLMRQS
jgi:hypothetical protein